MEGSDCILSQFQIFQQGLDEKHNKWERIVKLSRDITVESKRLIFLLHRIDILSSDRKEKQKILTTAKEKSRNILIKFQRIAMELKNEDGHAYIRAYSPGLQEFIEAMSFMYYFEMEDTVSVQGISKCLISITKLQQYLSFDDDSSEKICVPLPIIEYLLGIADITGEVMRVCVNSASKVTSSSSKIHVFKLCAFIRVLYEMFLHFSSIIDNSPSRKKYLQSKVDVMKSSLQKVEDCCYQLGIRDTELLDHSFSRDEKSY